MKTNDVGDATLLHLTEKDRARLKELPLLARALEFATLAHGSQVRKYDGKPYVTHCVRVADLLCSVNASSSVVAAGLLHDTLEDTDATAAQLDDLFGTTVTDLVLEVTDVSRPKDGNRRVRKSIDRVHLSCSSIDGATIKLADMIDNQRDIAANDPDFAKVYSSEMRLLLKYLQHGDCTLLQQISVRLLRGTK